MDEETLERFWSKVDKTPGCWEWQSSIRNGYGSFCLKGRPRTRRAVRAHRLAYELTYGPIPKGLHVLHKCDNPKCVRPNHLELGDHNKNMRDMSERGRVQRGESHYNASLTADDVREIRRLSAAGSWTQRGLAKKFGVTCVAVHKVIHRSTWGWLD